MATRTSALATTDADRAPPVDPEAPWVRERLERRLLLASDPGVAYSASTIQDLSGASLLKLARAIDERGGGR